MRGLTVRQIAAKLKIDPGTVITDLRAEEQLRADETAEQRETMLARQLAVVDDLYRKSMAKAGKPGTGALAAAAKALEMRARLLGLDAPTKVDVGLDKLLEALEPT